MRRSPFQDFLSGRHIPARVIGCLALAVVAVVALAAPAHAGSVWDPEDVTGPLEIRWLGATFQADDTMRVTVSFYDDFQASALPTLRGNGDRERGEIRVRLTEFLEGYFAHRQDGQLVFVWGDFGSSCCNVTRARSSSADVLRVTFATLHDDADPTFEVRAESHWKIRGNLVRDRTGTIDLGQPPEP